VCIFLSCKANARVKLTKTGHGPHSSTVFVICVVRLLFVLFCVLFVCKCVLPPGDNPIAVNKYITSHASRFHFADHPQALNILHHFKPQNKMNIHFKLVKSYKFSVGKVSIGKRYKHRTS